MSRFRMWLIDVLIGDASYIRNCTINGVVGLREDHNVNCCCFIGDSYVFTPFARWPAEVKND